MIKESYLLFVLFSVITLCSRGASQGPEWKSAVFDSKPYVLEVAYAELPAEKGPPDFSGGPSEEFLKKAERLRIAVSEKDQGEISTSDFPTFIYRLKDDFALEFTLITEIGGKREINTRLQLPMNEWVLAGLRRENQDAKILEYQVAVRVRARRQTDDANPGESFQFPVLIKERAQLNQSD